MPTAFPGHVENGVGDRGDGVVGPEHLFVDDGDESASGDLANGAEIDPAIAFFPLSSGLPVSRFRSSLPGVALPSNDVTESPLAPLRSGFLFSPHARSHRALQVAFGDALFDPVGYLVLDPADRFA